MKRDDYLLLGIKLRIVADVFGWTQAEASRKVGMSIAEYKKIEEAEHAPDSEKTLKLVKHGMKGFTPYDARTRISAEMVEILFGREHGR